METGPVDRIGEAAAGETPEDVAVLYSWANLEGAKYRDFSANRREYRAQMRHRAAEQLRLAELRAQSEAEAAAAHAEAEAAAARANADAASVTLAASRSITSHAPADILQEREIEELRRASLREAAQQARRAAAERVEATRRAQAAALAYSIAQREEREVTEAHESALRQAAQYQDSEQRGRQKAAKHFESYDEHVPGQISDPYSPQASAEEKDYGSSENSVSEPESDRTRTQWRPFSDRQAESGLPPYRASSAPMDSSLEHSRGDHRTVVSPRPLPERADSDLRQAEPPARSYPPNLYRGPLLDSPGAARPEVVRQIPANDHDLRSQGGEQSYLQRRWRDSYKSEAHNGSFPSRERFVREEDDLELSKHESGARRQDAIQQLQMTSAPTLRARPGSEEMPAAEQQDGYKGPQLFSATYREAGTWLRDVSERERATDTNRGSRTAQNSSPQPERPMNSTTPSSSRPSVEANYDTGQFDATLDQPDELGKFRQSWLSQVQAQHLSRRHAEETPVASERPTPRWLYPDQVSASGTGPGATVTPDAPRRGETAAVFNTETANIPPTRLPNASRWFALRSVFARAEATRPMERSEPDLNKKTLITLPIVAVYSLAGGVGKTSLVATLGRALSSFGEKVLLTDTTSNGLLPYYFGANDPVPGVVRTFSAPSGDIEAHVQLLRYDLGHKGSSPQLRAELVDNLLANSQQANRVLLDIGASCGWLVESLARLKPMVLVPLSADMNSVVNLQALEQRFAATTSSDGEPIRPIYLLNQFDPSLPLHLDLQEMLREKLGDRLLPFQVRRAAGISEALAEGMTILDYDLDSPAIHDFMRLARWVRSVSAPSDAGFRNLRWSEQ